eukprot:TRINITY_DN141639_c0_g1_i1.p1 TRINITY_DN141639_c0_g1~~TRINITY_DN141639_c0_g1_i1.p1  ORF type:complete len:236 (+),score=30.49 TRINITY_DN141639_c0_g1_i1:3-710(+)
MRKASRLSSLFRSTSPLKPSWKSLSGFTSIRTLFTLPKLPYDLEKGLAPAISAKALDIHYNNHHATYVNNANKLVQGTPYEKKEVVKIIQEVAGDSSKVAIFNNVAQHFNHSFFWESMTPGGSTPSSGISSLIDKHFKSFDAFKEKFSQMAVGNFGSGWTWLVLQPDGSLEIVNTSNAATPVSVPGVTPLLTLDVWEHGYYVDYTFKRAAYVQSWWSVVNWNKVGERYDAALKRK